MIAYRFLAVSGVTKKAWALILSFFVLSSSFASLCLANTSLLPSADYVPKIEDQDHSHHDGQTSPIKNKIPCYKGHLCCPSIVQSLPSCFFLLGSQSINPLEISFQPLEIEKSLYRPPEILGLSL